MMKNSLTILAQSLDKKIAILEKIQEYNELQEKSFLSGEADLDSFDKAFTKKDELIEELDLLDAGFETLYGEIKRELENNRPAYAEEIKGLQNQIRRITELSNSIQAKEARNKKLVEEYFAKRRGEIRQGRQRSRAAYDYYKSMSGAGARDSNLWDTKQ